MDYSIDIISTDELQDVQMPANKAFSEIKIMVMASFHKARNMAACVSLVMLLADALPASADNTIRIDTRKIENVIDADFSLTKDDVGQVYSIRSVRNAVRLETKLDAFLLLKEGWDGEVAAAPNRHAIAHARMTVRFLPENILQYSAVFPSNDSGVYLQGKFPERKARYTAFFDGKYMSYMIRGGEILTKTNVSVNEDNIKALEKDIMNSVGL